MAWPWKAPPNNLEKVVQAEGYTDSTELDSICWLLWLDEGVKCKSNDQTGGLRNRLFNLQYSKLHFFEKVGKGKGYRLRLGQFLSLYSTLGDALSVDPCRHAEQRRRNRNWSGHTRAANMKFSAKWVDDYKTYHFPHKGTLTRMKTIRRIVPTQLLSPPVFVHRDGISNDSGKED